jgi:hypothetical protein
LRTYRKNMAESYLIKQQFDFWTIPSRTIYNSIINLSDQTCTLWINNMMPKTYRKFNSINYLWMVRKKKEINWERIVNWKRNMKLKIFSN